jgi:hypothetical protein
MLQGFVNQGYRDAHGALVRERDHDVRTMNHDVRALTLILEVLTHVRDAL